MIFSTPDILFSIILAFFTITGFRRGFISEIARLTSLFASCYIASKYYYTLTPIIGQYFVNDKITQVTAFLALLITTIIIINILSSIVQRIFEFIYLGWLNRLIGSLIGFIKGLIVISIIIFCMEILPEETIMKIKNESTIYKVGENIKDVVLSQANYNVNNKIDFKKISDGFDLIEVPSLDSLINK
tara:strand:- start:2370 stop:2930 length:561 start_codon:yes stop_codon:yes gene_type:complete